MLKQINEIQSILDDIKKADNHSMDEKRIDKLLRVAIYALVDVSNELSVCSNSYLLNTLSKDETGRVFIEALIK